MRDNFQARVQRWMLHTFGKEISNDRQERGWRMIEEALELAQAVGVTREDVDALADYTYSKPPGTVTEEVGGVRVTLAALCEAHGVEEDECAVLELEHKCWPKAEKIRQKQATKPRNNSPLPVSPQGE